MDCSSAGNESEKTWAMRPYTPGRVTRNAAAERTARRAPGSEAAPGTPQGWVHNSAALMPRHWTQMLCDAVTSEYGAYLRRSPGHRVGAGGDEVGARTAREFLAGSGGFLADRARGRPGVGIIGLPGSRAELVLVQVLEGADELVIGVHLFSPLPGQPLVANEHLDPDKE
jgi:hypothetical protein